MLEHLQFLNQTRGYEQQESLQKSLLHCCFDLSSSSHEGFSGMLLQLVTLLVDHGSHASKALFLLPFDMPTVAGNPIQPQFLHGLHVHYRPTTHLEASAQTTLGRQEKGVREKRQDFKEWDKEREPHTTDASKKGSIK